MGTTTHPIERSMQSQGMSHATFIGHPMKRPLDSFVDLSWHDLVVRSNGNSHAKYNASRERF